MANEPQHCRFISSYDGVSRCAHRAHAQRFCHFHYQAFLAGEISAEGYLVDDLSHQVRRRELNFHGVHPEDVLVGPGSEASPDCTPPAD